MSINSTSFSDEASTVITPILPHLLQKPKRKRSLPGNPDPDAEVIALSPTTLMTTNRFVCEVCNKGFQRDQNLQLHRRGHNLPWKLKQRNNMEVIRKKVYVCPEPSCAHHHPSRALGDLTGIKKHFCRKHGEKSFQCEKCSKRYAVHSDWKAHVKTCGTREYRCDCGTLFPRKDSFITHRAFCKALAEESARVMASVSFSGNGRLSPPTPTPIDPLSWAPSSLTSGSASTYTTTVAPGMMMTPPAQYLLYLPPPPSPLLPAPAVSATALLQKAAAAAGPLAGHAGSFHGLDMQWGGDVLARSTGSSTVLRAIQEDVKETTTRDFLGETVGRPAAPWLPAFPPAMAGGGDGGGGVGPERLGLSWREGMGPMMKQPITAFGPAQYYNSAWSDYY